MEQNEINSTITQLLETLADNTDANHNQVHRLLSFQDKRMESLENKVDILMSERDYAPALENEVVNFDGHYFEVAPSDILGCCEFAKATIGFCVFNKWRLPTIDELRLMYISMERLGMQNQYYWSSSESNDRVWGINFNNGYTNSHHGGNTMNVRLVKTLHEQ